MAKARGVRKERSCLGRIITKTGEGSDCVVVDCGIGDWVVVDFAEGEGWLVEDGGVRRGFGRLL